VQTRRQFVKTVPIPGTGLLLTENTVPAAQSRGAPSAPGGDSWDSPSLRSETVTGPNGAVTTRAALLANDKWGIGNTKRIEQVTACS